MGEIPHIKIYNGPTNSLNSKLNLLGPSIKAQINTLANNSLALPEYFFLLCFSRKTKLIPIG